MSIPAMAVRHFIGDLPGRPRISAPGPDVCDWTGAVEKVHDSRTMPVEAQSAPAQVPLVLSEKTGGVVRLALNRPERFNPLSSEMIGALQQAVDAVAADPEARVV